jgi:hypothetical protein
MHSLEILSYCSFKHCRIIDLTVLVYKPANVALGELFHSASIPKTCILVGTTGYTIWYQYLLYNDR